MSHANFPRFLVGQNVPPPWGTNFETRDALEAMRAEAVRSHLAATAPVQARARAAALRRARKGGLASGALGGGLAVIAVWLVTASVIGNGAPATATASVSAPPAAAPAPAFPAGAQEGAQAVARSAPVAAADADVAAAPSIPPAVLVPTLAERAGATPVAMVAADDARGKRPPRSGDAGARWRAGARDGLSAKPVQQASHAVPHPQPRSAGVRLAAAVATAVGVPERGGIGEAPVSEFPDAAYLRPSAVAYLPPDARIELLAHVRLTGD